MLQKYTGLLYKALHVSELLPEAQINKLLKDPSGGILKELLADKYDKMTLEHIDAASRFFGINCFTTDFVSYLFSEEVFLDLGKTKLDGRTKEQKATLDQLQKDMLGMFSIKVKSATVHRHDGNSETSSPLHMLKALKFFQAKGKTIADMVACQVSEV